MKLFNEIELKKFINWIIVCFLELCRSFFNCYYYYRLWFIVSYEKYEFFILVIFGEYVVNCFGNYCVNLIFYIVLCVFFMLFWRDIKGVKIMIDLFGIYFLIMIIWLFSFNVFKDFFVLLLFTIYLFMWFRFLIIILMFSSVN